MQDYTLFKNIPAFPDASIITKLITETIELNYYNYHFNKNKNKTKSPKCLYCNKEESINHFLFECINPKYINHIKYFKHRIKTLEVEYQKSIPLEIKYIIYGFNFYNYNIVRDIWREITKFVIATKRFEQYT